MVAQPPVRPPLKLEDFLWNMHSTLVASGPLGLEQLKDAYSKHMGHKCVIERFLVVGEGGLGATLKRIPHIVTLVPSDGGGTSVRASQPPDINRQQLIEADQAFRRDLQKKNAIAKAKAAAGAKAAAVAPKAGGTASPPAGAPEPAVKAAAPSPTGDGQAKRPAEGPPAAAADPKKPRPDSDADTLARMLVQGVVRVLQNRAKAGKGPLPMSELEEEFKALWKVPFNLQQAGEQDAVTFLQKWPGKVELYHDGTQQLVMLSKKGQEKAKATEAAPAAAKAAPTGGQTSPTAASPPAAPGVAKPPPKPAAPTGATAAKQPPAAAKVPSATTSAAKSPTATTTAAKAPAAVAAAAGGAAAAKPAAEGSAAAAKGAPGGPARPPSSVEDFLWNIHTVIDAHGGPMPLDQLKDAYSKHLGHKCAIERFLVVGDGGLAATLKRIPHVVVVATDKEGSVTLKAALPSGTTKEQLIAADHQYRRQLQQKNAAAKARQVPTTATAKGSPPAAGATPAVASAAAPAAVPTGTAPAGAAAAPAPAAAPSGGPAPAASTAEKRPADGPAAGDASAKRPRPEDADTLARMLVQGIVRVLQNRQRDSKGPLPVNSLEEEFKALWKVPFNLAQAGETDPVTFLQKWPNKVEVITEGGQTVVQLAKKAAEKAKAAGGPPPGGSGPTLPLSPDAEAKKASPATAPATTKTGAAAASPAAATAGQSAAPAAGAGAPPPAAAAAASPNSLSTTVGRSVAGVSKDTGKAARASPRTGGDDEPTTTTASAPAEEPASADGVEAVECTQAPERGSQSLPELCEEAEGMMQMMQEMLRKQEALVSSLRRLSADKDAA